MQDTQCGACHFQSLLHPALIAPNNAFFKARSIPVFINTTVATQTFVQQLFNVPCLNFHYSVYFSSPSPVDGRTEEVELCKVHQGCCNPWYPTRALSPQRIGIARPLSASTIRPPIANRKGEIVRQLVASMWRPEVDQQTPKAVFQGGEKVRVQREAPLSATVAYFSGLLWFLVAGQGQASDGGDWAVRNTAVGGSD
jgi:hypothetical protein